MGKYTAEHFSENFKPGFTQDLSSFSASAHRNTAIVDCVSSLVRLVLEGAALQRFSL